MKPLAPQQILQANYTLPKILLVYGEELQLIGECREFIKQRFNKENIQYAYFDELANSTIAVDQGSSLFGEAAPFLTMVIGFAKPDKSNLDAMMNMLARADAPNCLFIELHNISDKKAAWFRNIKDHESVQSVYAPVLSASAAQTWISRFAAEQNVALDSQAAQFLSEQTEGNLMAAKQAIIKMSLMAGKKSGGDNDDNSGDNEATPVDSEMVKTTLSDGASYTVFDLADNVLAGQATRALKILHHLRLIGNMDPLIVWSLSDIVNNAMLIHAGKSPRAWGQRAAQLQQLARKIDATTAQQLTHTLAYADRVIKGNAVGDDETILSHLIIQLAAVQRGLKVRMPSYIPQ